MFLPSTRNLLHLLAGANEYRSVDPPFNSAPRPDQAGDAWLGVFESEDSGDRWQNPLLDGHPQQTHFTSPLKGFEAGVDSPVRAAGSFDPPQKPPDCATDTLGNAAGSLSARPS